MKPDKTLETSFKQDQNMFYFLHCAQDFVNIFWTKGDTGASGESCYTSAATLSQDLKVSWAGHDLSKTKVDFLANTDGGGPKDYQEIIGKGGWQCSK